MTTYATLLGLIGSLAGLVALFAWLWARARSAREVAEVELALERWHVKTLLQTIADAKASQARLLADLAIASLQTSRAIIVVAPLIIPLGEIFGIHPVHLGIIFLANLELGYLTPPVGLNLFLASYRFNVPLVKVYRNVVPFFLVLLVTVLLLTYVPWFSLALLPK